MIMKANKQIGFIYKNNESIDTILKDGDVVFEKGFLREKTSTALPITFGGVGKDLKDYKVYGNTYQNSTSGINEWNSFNKVQTDDYKVLEDGTIQLINSASTSNGYTSISKSLKEMCPNLNVGDTVYLYIVSTWYRKEIYSSSIGPWTNGNSKTLTQQMLDSNIILYGGYRTTSTIKIMITKNQYYDTYEPYTNGASPNPDYPQEIISCGDRTKNLFDKNTTNILNAYYESSGDTIKSSNGNKIFYFACRPNTIYSFTQGISALSNHIFQIATTNEKPELGVTVYDYYEVGRMENYTYTTSSTAKYILLRIRKSDYTDNYLSTIQIEENSSATPYEPYGYKIPVNVRSENLFDKDNANLVHLYTDGTVIKNSAGANTYYIKCKSNTTYTIIKSNAGTNNRFCVFTCDDIPTAGMQILNYIGTPVGTDNSASYTINTPNNAKYLCVFVSVESTNPSASEIANSIMIVEGSTVPSKYIPYYNETTNIYLDEPLRKIDEYSDYIDFVNGKVVRNIKEVILNGSETWKQSSVRNVVHNIMLEDMLPPETNSTNYINGISDKFINDTNYNQLTGSNYNRYFNRMSATSDKYLSFSYKTTTTINDWKTWLQSNNVTVDYVLSTPTEESIALPSIPTVDGNNILNIETEITPSQVYIKYKSNT